MMIKFTRLKKMKRVFAWIYLRRAIHCLFFYYYSAIAVLIILPNNYIFLSFFPYSPLSIPMVVVTINILVFPRPFVVTHLLVVKSVSSLPGVLVESEVPLKSVMMEKNKPKSINTKKICLVLF